MRQIYHIASSSSSNEKSTESRKEILDVQHSIIMFLPNSFHSGSGFIRKDNEEKVKRLSCEKRKQRRDIFGDKMIVIVRRIGGGSGRTTK